MRDPVTDERSVRLWVDPEWGMPMRQLFILVGLVVPIVLVSTTDAPMLWPAPIVGLAIVLWGAFSWGLAWAIQYLLPTTRVVLQRRDNGEVLIDGSPTDWARDARLEHPVGLTRLTVRDLAERPLAQSEGGEAPDGVVLKGSVGEQHMTVEAQRQFDAFAPLVGAWVVGSIGIMGWMGLGSVVWTVLAVPVMAATWAMFLFLVLLCLLTGWLFSGRATYDQTLVVRPGTVSVGDREFDLEHTRFVLVEEEKDALLVAVDGDGPVSLFRSTVSAGAWVRDELRSATRSLSTDEAGEPARVPEALDKLRRRESQ